MRRFKRRIRHLLRNRNGASTIELGLIAAMIVLAMMTALQGVANQNALTWNKIQSSTATAISQSNA